ncbi:hypothetical protein SLE2022_366110 [Rubroshorea leprosula]
MVKRRAKKTVEQAPKSPEHLGDGVTKKCQNEKKDVPLIYREVERQIAAIRGVRDVEIEHMLILLHLLRSYAHILMEQPYMLLFYVVCPWLILTALVFYLLVALSYHRAEQEVEILHFGFRWTLFWRVCRTLKCLECMMLFKHPGGSSQRLSIGMTPKTLRLPKPESEEG